MSQARQDKQALPWFSETGDFTGNTDFPCEGWRGCEGAGGWHGPPCQQLRGLLARPALGAKGEGSSGGRGEEDEEWGARRAGVWGGVE